MGRKFHAYIPHKIYLISLDSSSYNRNDEFELFFFACNHYSRNMHICKKKQVELIFFMISIFILKKNIKELTNISKIKYTVYCKSLKFKYGRS